MFSVFGWFQTGWPWISMNQSISAVASQRQTSVRDWPQMWWVLGVMADDRYGNVKLGIDHN